MRFKFVQPLQLGTIISRPNRFIMNVEIDGQQYLAHCPTTGRIGDLNFTDSNIPCLVSESRDLKRKTKFTVEAISVEPVDGDEWIGINQMKANTYVRHLLDSDQLSNIMSGVVSSEVSFGKSRLDFKVGGNYLEVKMPLISLPTPSHVKRLKQNNSKPAFHRLIKHFGELSDSLDDSNINENKKAVLALVFMYDAARFVPPEATEKNKDIMAAATRAKNSGVENWQINMKIDRTGVELRDYFRV